MMNPIANMDNKVDKDFEELTLCLDEIARLNNLVGQKEDYDSGGAISSRFEYLHGRGRELWSRVFKEELS